MSNFFNFSDGSLSPSLLKLTNSIRRRQSIQPSEGISNVFSSRRIVLSDAVVASDRLRTSSDAPRKIPATSSEDVNSIVNEFMEDLLKKIPEDNSDDVPTSSRRLQNPPLTIADALNAPAFESSSCDVTSSESLLTRLTLSDAPKNVETPVTPSEDVNSTVNDVVKNLVAKVSEDVAAPNAPKNIICITISDDEDVEIPTTPSEDVTSIVNEFMEDLLKKVSEDVPRKKRNPYAAIRSGPPPKRPKGIYTLPEVPVSVVPDSGEHEFSDSDLDDVPTSSRPNPPLTIADALNTRAPDSSLDDVPTSSRPLQNPPLTIAEALALNAQAPDSDSDDDTAPLGPNPESDDVNLPPSMTKQRGQIYEHCIKISAILTSEYDAQRLLNDRREWTKLYRNLVLRNLLRMGGEMERLPIYVFMMAPKTQKIYLEGVRINKMPTRQNLHKLVYTASRIRDEDVAECIQKCISDGWKGNKLEMCLEKIKDGMDWRDTGRFISGLRKVQKIEDVPDGGFLVCYEDMPFFPIIQSKNLNCVVVKPSPTSKLLIDASCPNHIYQNISEKGYGGNEGQLHYYCFGPDIVKKEGNYPISGSMNAIFHKAMQSGLRTKIPMYAVQGFY